MKQKLTVVKVGGKIVETPHSLELLLQGFARLEGPKVLKYTGEGAPPPTWPQDLA